MKQREIREGATYGATFWNQKKRERGEVTRKVLKVGGPLEIRNVLTTLRSAGLFEGDTPGPRSVAAWWIAYEENRFGRQRYGTCTLATMATWAERDVSGLDVGRS